ncbi:MAG: cyclic nucleotide-binding domain-containing protein [Desulfococcaceae bacterium]
MSFPKALFEIIEENKCPFYEMGDVFALSGKALLLDQKEEKTFISTTVIQLPKGKSSCRIIIEDLSEVLIKYKSVDRVPGFKIRCGGCTGSVLLEYRRYKDPVPSASDTDIEVFESLLGSFSFFQVLDENDLRLFVPLLKMEKYGAGDIVIRKGEPGKRLYIIVSGLVEVIGRNDASIAFLGKGEVFGEMSLLTGEPVTATIKVAESSKVLYMEGNDFRRLLNRSASLQMYFTRLLSRRLTEVNLMRAEEFDSGMVGNLTEMPPSELFQALNVNQKTGVLKLHLAAGPAEIAFRDGRLVRSEYNGKQGREAFYGILREKEGRFRFIGELPAVDWKTEEFGDFTWMLMDGFRRIDEEKE